MFVSAYADDFWEIQKLEKETRGEAGLGSESHLPWWFCFPSGSCVLWFWGSGSCGRQISRYLMMLSSRVVHGVQSKSGLSDVLHKMATKIYVASSERRSASSSVLRPSVAMKTGSLQGPNCSYLFVQGCSCNFWVATTKIFMWNISPVSKNILSSTHWGLISRVEDK